MIFNSNLRDELTDLLADHLTLCESDRVRDHKTFPTPWDFWRNVASQAMDFVYGSEVEDPNHWSNHQGPTDLGACCGGVCGCDAPRGVAGPGDMGQEVIIGVVSPPTTPVEVRRTRFVPTPGDVLQSPIEGSGPAPGLGDGHSAPSSPGQAEEAE